MMQRIRVLVYYIRRHWLPFFIALAILFSITAAILRLITPPIPTVPETDFVTQNFDGSTSRFRNITYTGETPTLPEKLNIASVENIPNQAAFIEQQLVQSFQLTQSADDPNFFSGSTYSMVKIPEENQYFLSQNEAQASFSGVITKDQAVTVAQSFVLRSIPNTTLSPQPTGVLVLQGTEDYEPNKQETGAFIKVPFAYQLNGLPIFYSTTSDYPFEIIVNANRQVQKFSFFTQFVNLKPLETEFTPLTIPQALQNINNGKASIISSRVDKAGPLSLESITSGELTSVRLEYRVDPNLQLSYPFYRFTGKVKNSQNDDIEVEVLTPAVSTRQEL